MSSSAQKPEPWTILKLLEWTEQFFEKKGIENPRLNAQSLLGKVLGLERIMLYVQFDRVVGPEQLAQYRDYVKRRAAREPLQYIIGVKDFYGRKFRVTTATLIPRPETELLVKKTLELVPAHAEARVLDLCTGSGCIAVTLAVERPQWRLWGTDVSAEAVALARQNAAELRATQIQFLVGSLWAPLIREGTPERSFDAVVSNPPYIKTGSFEALQPEVRDFEPRIALDGGPDGLNCYREIIPGAARWLKPGGWLVLEVDPDIVDGLRAIFDQGGDYFTAEFHQDFDGNARVLTAQLKQPVPGDPGSGLS